MKFILSVLFLLQTAIFLHGEERSRTRIYIPPSEQQKVSVKVDQSNVSRQRRDFPLKLKAPAHTMAARLGMPGDELIWTPATDPASGLSRIKTVVQSPDRSVLAYIEETGSDPFGSRLILFNTVDWFFPRVFDLPRRITALCLDRTTDRAAFSAMAQESMKEKNGIGILNCSTGKIQSFMETEKVPVQIAWSSRSRGFFVIFPEDGHIHLLNTKGGKKTLRKIRNISLIAVVPDGSAIAAASDREFYLLNAADGTVLSSQKFQDACKPHAFAFPSQDGKQILLARQMPGSNMTGLRCSLVLIAGDRNRLIRSNITGLIAASSSGTVCYTAEFVRGKVSTVSLKDCSVQSSCNPISQRPAASGMLFRLYPGFEPQEFLAADTSGGVSKLIRKGNRWYKSRLRRP